MTSSASDSDKPASGFFLNPQLESDTLPIGELPLTRVLLMDDRRYPWLILVPKRPEITEITDLSESDTQTLMAEIRLVMSVLNDLRKPDKLNVAALGNVVSQLHIHIIARFHSDAAWPHPVWGVGDSESYPPHTAHIFMGGLRDAFKARGISWISARP